MSEKHETLLRIAVRESPTDDHNALQEILIAQLHAGQRADPGERILNYGVWDLQRRVQVVIDHDIRINGPQGASLRLIAAKEASK